MEDYIVGPDTLAEMLQARAFCAELLLKLVLDCSFPGNAVACLISKLLVYRASELCQIRACCC